MVCHSLAKGYLMNNRTPLLLTLFFSLETGLMNETMATDSPRRPSRCTGGVVVRPQAVT